MKSLTLSAAMVAVLGTGVVHAQDGHMMNGGWMGGYGGVWNPIVLVVVVGVLLMVVMQRRK